MSALPSKSYYDHRRSACPLWANSCLGQGLRALPKLPPWMRKRSPLTSGTLLLSPPSGNPTDTGRSADRRQKILRARPQRGYWLRQRPRHRLAGPERICCGRLRSVRGSLAQARRLHPGVEFRRASLPELDGVADASFVNVLCETEVIMHLEPVVIPAAVRRFITILKPGGTLYLTWRLDRRHWRPRQRSNGSMLGSMRSWCLTR